MDSFASSEQISHRMANEVLFISGESDAAPRLLMPTTVANLGAKIPPEELRKIEASQSTEQEARELIQHIHTLPTRTTHYLYHPSPSIKDSIFVWHDDSQHLVQFYSFSDTSIDKSVQTTRGNEKSKTVTQLLDDFCQKVEHSTPVSEFNFISIGVFTSFLFQAYDGSKFKKDEGIWGVQGLAEVNRSRHIKVLHKRLQGNPVAIMTLGNNEIILHKDTAMLERDLVNYSIIGQGDDNDFAFVIIVNIKDPAYVEAYEFPAPAFDVILAMGCLNFVRGRHLVNDPAYQTEAARLTRRIGEGVFQQSSRPMASVVEGGEGAEVGEASTAPSPPHRQPKKKTTKRRSKKKVKKVKNQAGVVDEVEGVEEDVPASMVVVATGSATAIAKLPASSSLLPPPIPPIPVFSFARSSPLLTCAHPGCNRPTHTTGEGTVVICPRCTAYSTTRYCRAEHLLDPIAMRSHFLADSPNHRCGLGTLIRGAVADTTDSIPESCLPPRPYIHEDESHETAGFPKNILERHRQAVWRSMGSLITTTTETETETTEEQASSSSPSSSSATLMPQSLPQIDTAMTTTPPTSDYYIFNDLTQIPLHLGIPTRVLRAASLATKKLWLNQVRGLGTVLAHVRISSATTARVFVDGTLHVTTNLQVKFDEALDECLRFGFAAGTLKAKECLFVYVVVRAELQRMGWWDGEMCEALVVQMGFEFGWRCPEDEIVVGTAGAGTTGAGTDTGTGGANGDADAGGARGAAPPTTRLAVKLDQLVAGAGAGADGRVIPWRALAAGQGQTYI